ncbi:hypothetical protein AAGW05_01950 [Arthrobacter sp. LAPM80]|uniref:hypothetical protein n=1 Tax=Arthrobacter sp. LAPM80 TaxID=3141788 RepID=UPI00398BA62B
MDIEVTIERLVLDGLDLELGGAEALAEALESELARIVTGFSGASVPAGFAPQSAVRMVLPPVVVPAGSHPRTLGRQIGASVAGGLNRG